MITWFACLYGVIVAVWWNRLSDYFMTRNSAAGIDRGSHRLAAVALTGHMCDVTMGLVLLPISRHSALASFFKISTHSAFLNHVIAAYTLFSLVVIHGLLYVSWVRVFNNLSAPLRMVIPVLNPTYLYHEVWPGNASALGQWRASLIFTGSIVALLMAILFVTTLPKIRAAHFNLFYFTHLLSIPTVIIVCLHASTMFYCTAPGLAMWVLDWAMRFYELRGELTSTLSALGNGWYCITVLLPRNRLAGCSCRSPLAHFYLHHAGSSIRELHPFTTVSHLASTDNTTHSSSDNIPIQFVFRKQGKVARRDREVNANAYSSSRTCRNMMAGSIFHKVFRSKKARVESTEWTSKLAGLVDKEIGTSEYQDHMKAEDIRSLEQGYIISERKIGINVRAEGPYFSHADPYRYNTVICMVGGTGISGALAIASAFKYHQQRFHHQKEDRSGLPPKSHPEPAELHPTDFDRPSAVTEKLHRLKTNHDYRKEGEIDGKPRIWNRCVILWSLKATDNIDLIDIGLLSNPRDVPGLELKVFLSGTSTPKDTGIGTQNTNGSQSVSRHTENGGQAGVAEARKRVDLGAELGHIVLATDQEKIDTVGVSNGDRYNEDGVSHENDKTKLHVNEMYDMDDGKNDNKDVGGSVRACSDCQVPQGIPARQKGIHSRVESDVSGSKKKTWVYISGPDPYINAAKEACQTMQTRLKAQKVRTESKQKGGEGTKVANNQQQEQRLDFYAASWTA